MVLTVNVVFPANRDNLGELSVSGSIVGPASWFCYGRADYGTAKDNNNVGAVPTKKFGHTPVGNYLITAIRPVPGPDKPKYGAQDALRIQGINGDALTRWNAGTNDLLIHGGPPKFGAALLRPTNGCIRMLDLDMQALIAALLGATFPIAMTVVQGTPGQTVVGALDEGYYDPAEA